MLYSGVGGLSNQLEVLQNLYLGNDHQGSQASLCFSTVRQFAEEPLLNACEMTFSKVLGMLCRSWWRI